MPKLALQVVPCVVSFVLSLAACSGVVQSEGTIGVTNPTGGTPTGTSTTTSVTLRLDGGTVNAPGGDAGPSMSNNCGSQSVDLTRRPPEVLLVLDQSASMSEDGLWPFVQPAVLQVVKETENDLNWGLLLYPLQKMGECTAASLPSATKVDVAMGLRNYSAIADKVPATAEGDGTPTDSAILEATKYLAGLGTPNPKYILLATDGAPSCVGAAKNSGGSGATKPSVVAAVNAVTSAAAAGIPTFVVGAAKASSSSSLMVLNGLADAGGFALPHTPCPSGASASQCTGPEYLGFYLATDQAKLVAAFKSIIGNLNTCQIQLSNLPPNPQQVAVAITDANGKTSAIYQGNGANPEGEWHYTDGTHTGIQVTGNACKTIAAGAGGKVQIWYGCTIPPIL